LHFLQQSKHSLFQLSQILRQFKKQRTSAIFAQVELSYQLLQKMQQLNISSK